MTTNSKALAAGLAIMVASATVGWNASKMSNARPAAAPDTTAWVTAQEQPKGDLTPQTRYQPAPVKKSPARVVRHRPVVRPRQIARGITIPAGTPVAVVLNTSLSSKTAVVGDSWVGTVAAPVYANGREVIPAGSTVRGVVVVADPAERGSRATLQLAMRSISVNGRSYTVRGSSEAVVAGSPRLRNVGAIAGGAAAGALIGKVVGHSTKSTVIGAVVGGTAATAAVAASKGYQATIPAGQEMQFTTGSSMTVRA